MLQVNDHIFGAPREILCVAVALAAHVPLYFWHAKPDLGPLGDPITEIEFSVEQEEAAKPPPPVQEKKEEKSFFERMQEAVGLATPKPLPKLIIPEKPKTELAGTSGPNEIKPAAHMVESMQKQAKLTDKERGLAGGFDVSKIETKSAGLSGVGLGPGDKVGGGGTIQQKSAGFKMAQGDLPFAVKKGGGNDLLNSDADAPKIALANRTDKRVKTVSTDFFGTGGGTGGGDGAGNGGGGNLKDKSGGKGLVGVSGGFSPIGAPGTSTGSGGGGLVGSPTGSGRAGPSAGSSHVPYEISGPLSRRRVLYHVLPPLPDWAREKGIIAVVVIDFYVRPSGSVNANKTSVFRSCGYQKIDTSAMEALSQWRFEPVTTAEGEQYGRITIKFKAL